MQNLSGLKSRTEKTKKPNSIYIVPDLLEEILLGLPLKSILKFKTVSKQWRSILESKMFVERRTSLQKKRPKILAACKCNCGRRPSLLPKSLLEGDEEIVYLHCDAARPLMTCEGLVCITEPDWFNVLNPSNGQLRRFLPGPDPVKGEPTNCAWGFGRDIVTGSYKVVRICFNKWVECGILNVETGEWSNLWPPPLRVDVRCKSVYVNGSIYWLKIMVRLVILAFDVHNEKFNIVRVPAAWITQETQLVNLEDHLAIAMTSKLGPEWILHIWTMDNKPEKEWYKIRYHLWSKTYSISLAHNVVVSWHGQKRWFTPVSVSKQGDIVFYDNHKRLFKYYSGTDQIRCLSSDICVISSHFENLIPLPQLGNLDSKIRTSRCRFMDSASYFYNRFIFTSLVLVASIWFTHLQE